MIQSNNNTNPISKYLSFLSNPCLQTILKNHKDAVNEYDKSNAFTIFEIISNLYYRENIHSDLIAFLLDPTQNHNYGLLGLRLFIDLINKKTGWSIDSSYYELAEVVREQNKIDILIKDNHSMRAILVENKMNKAPDMDRQIPRYCDILIDQGYQIDAAIYLPLNRFKKPDESTWNEEDKQWENLIVNIPAVSSKEDISLVRDWLNELSNKSINPDVKSIIRQYSYLIMKLNELDMDNESFKELYDYLMNNEGDNLDTALSFVEMMNRFPQYLAQRLCNLYSDNCAPFAETWLYNKTVAVFENYMVEGISFYMDVSCYIDHYYIKLSVRNGELSNKYTSIKNMLKTKGIRAFDVFEEENEYCISCQLPIKTAIDEFVTSILKNLRLISK